MTIYPVIKVLYDSIYWSGCFILVKIFDLLLSLLSTSRNHGVRYRIVTGYRSVDVRLECGQTHLLVDSRGGWTRGGGGDIGGRWAWPLSSYHMYSSFIFSTTIPFSPTCPPIRARFIPTCSGFVTLIWI